MSAWSEIKLRLRPSISKSRQLMSCRRVPIAHFDQSRTQMAQIAEQATLSKALTRRTSLVLKTWRKELRLGTLRSRILVNLVRNWQLSQEPWDLLKSYVNRNHLHHDLAKEQEWSRSHLQKWVNQGRRQRRGQTTRSQIQANMRTLFQNQSIWTEFTKSELRKAQNWTGKVHLLYLGVELWWEIMLLVERQLFGHLLSIRTSLILIWN